MRSRRRMVPALLALLIAAGCSSTAGESPVAAPPSTTTSATTTTTTTTSPPPTTTTTTTPPPPRDPIDVFNIHARAEGWLRGSDKSASVYVGEICAELDGPERPEYGTHGERMEGEWKNSPALFETGVPLICPRHQKLLDAAKTGNVDRVIRDGSYLVPDEIKPGKYRTMMSPVKDCYWERTSAGGDILDNNFVTAARVLDVTVRAADGAFTTRGCGPWRKVG